MESASGGSETWEIGDLRDAVGAGLGGLHWVSTWPGCQGWCGEGKPLGKDFVALCEWLGAKFCGAGWEQPPGCNC